MDWSWNYNGLRANSKDIKWSDCREIVEVPGGEEWKIRRLEESSPEYCWKYCGTSPLAQYHFEMALKQTSTNDCGAGDSANLPVFYATVPHFVSPFELSIQPRFLEKARRNLSKHMAAEYCRADAPSFSEDQGFAFNYTNIRCYRIIYLHMKRSCWVRDEEEFHALSTEVTYIRVENEILRTIEVFVPVACACLVKEEWCRARVSKIKGDTSILVELVDYGTEVFSSLSDVRPLLLKFGRIPPMALKCRVKDVYINDLNAKKVDDFRRIIDECKRIVRVELLTTTEPFFINIFHPTLEGVNIGKLFHTPAEDENHELAKQRHWLDHIRRQNAEDDDYFETNEDSDYELENSTEQLYIRRFGRSPKPSHVTFDELFVGYIENARLIYLHTEWMIKRRTEIENSLAEQWSSLPKLPLGCLDINIACAVLLDGIFYRASIAAVLLDSIQLYLIDHGRHVSLSRADGDLRLLPSTDLFVEPPMVVVVALDTVSDLFPHPSCTFLLKEVLPFGTRVRFLPEKRHKRIPQRGKLIVIESSLDVEHCLWQRLRDAGVQLQCRELVPFRANNPLLQLLPRPDGKFVHRLNCPSVLIRGNLELSNLEPATA